MEPTTSAGTVVHCAGCIMCSGSKVDREDGEIKIREHSLNVKSETWKKRVLIKPCAVCIVCSGY